MPESNRSDATSHNEANGGAAARRSGSVRRAGGLPVGSVSVAAMSEVDTEMVVCLLWQGFVVGYAVALMLI